MIHARALSATTLLLVFALLPLCLFPWAASAQSATATLSGTVEDQNKAMVSGARVKAINLATGVERDTETNESGTFSIPLLPPSTYTIRVERNGFVTIEVSDVVLNVNDTKVLSIQMRVGDVKEVVNVTTEASLINDSPAVDTVVDRQFVGNLPLNGRSFQSLITLTPGTVLTRANNEEQGQFSVNGQRANANYFTIDGVGANIGNGFAFAPGQAIAGSVPGFSASGGTNNLVSVDALQEFKVQTSTYAPEFGRVPGGQVQIVTRSGANRFNGTLYEYFRNDKLDANDWFNNARRLARPPTRQNNFGFVLGGPILLPRFGEGRRQLGYDGRNRTFFFISYEGGRLRQPQSASTDVPSLEARQTAAVEIQPFLNAFPRPNGPTKANNFAEFAASFSIPSTFNATSIRIDHTFTNKLTLFGRYNHAPSETVPRGNVGSSLNNLNPTRVKTQTLTVGATLAITPTISNEFRGNYSKNRGTAAFMLDNLGGAVPLDDSRLFPSPFTSQNAAFSFRLSFAAGGVVMVGGNTDNLQRQFNLVDNLSVITSGHQFKLGVDYRRLSPVFAPRGYAQFANFNGVNGAKTAITSSASVQSFAGPHVFIFNNLSVYGQDTWKTTRRLTLTYGLRWELNPPPHEANGNEPFTVTGIDNPPTIALAPPGTLLYKTTYGNFAPRIGIAYNLFQGTGKETVLRGGFGLFYDLGYGSVANALRGYPFLVNKSLGAVHFPFTPAQAALPILDPNALIVEIFAVAPNLKLPRTYEWNASVEQALGSNQTISASYVGAAGRDLLRQEKLVSPNAKFFLVNVTRNAATSDYHAMQLQFQRRLSRGLQALASYTWSKSLDIASNDSSLNTPGARTDPHGDRGPSDFDVRHAFSAGVTYQLPAADVGAVGRAILRGWAIDTLVTARSATPVNVTVTQDIGFGSYDFRPDLIAGVPLYLNDATVGGGRRINPAAFTVPKGRQGTLGRYSLRGFPLHQLDFALRRQLSLTERVKLQLKGEVFNLFNHPNFANPDGVLDRAGGLAPNPNFGRSASMLGRSLGSGGQLGGFNPLYQVGGPRSIQLSLKLQF